MSERSGVEIRVLGDMYIISYRVTQGRKRNAIYAQHTVKMSDGVGALKAGVDKVWRDAVVKKNVEAGRASRKAGVD